VQRGSGETAAVTATDFTRVFASPDTTTRAHTTTVGTILRPIGRPCANIMAPLSCGASTPSTDVGVGATPPPRSTPSYVFLPRREDWSVGRLFFPILLSSIPPPPSAILRGDYPLTPSRTRARTPRSPSFLPLRVVFLFLSLSLVTVPPEGASPPPPPAATPLRIIAAARFRRASMLNFRSRSRGSTRPDAEGSFLALSG